jgi:hypothetical protein
VVGARGKKVAGLLGKGLSRRRRRPRRDVLAIAPHPRSQVPGPKKVTENPSWACNTTLKNGFHGTRQQQLSITSSSLKVSTLFNSASSTLPASTAGGRRIRRELLVLGSKVEIVTVAREVFFQNVIIIGCKLVEWINVLYSYCMREGCTKERWNPHRMMYQKYCNLSWGSEASNGN